MRSVLHICTDFWPSTGGIQQFVLDLAKHSGEIDVQAEVLCFNRTKGHPGRLSRDARVEGITVRRIPFLNLRYYKPTLIPWRLLQQFDVIHVHGIGAPLDWVAMTKKLHGRPIVVSTHGGIFHTSALSWLKRLYFNGPQRWIMRRIDAVAACSRSDAALFAAICDNVQLLENAVDVRPLLKLTTENKQQGRCLYVGRLAANKSIDRLLRAFAVATAGGANLSLRIVGPDVEGNQSSYRALAEGLGVGSRVAFIGALNQEALVHEYEHAENFLSASRYEGFGLAAIEAKAAGCRLVLQRNEAFQTLFASDASAALIDFDDPAIAGASLLRLLAQRPSSEIFLLREHAAIYSWEKKILDWSRLYRALMNGEIRSPVDSFTTP